MSNMTNRLSASRVKGLLEPGWYADGGGLYLRVKGPTQRTWVHVETIAGRRKERSIGSASKLTLAQAREKLNKPRDTLKRIPTFGEFADAYLASRETHWTNAKHRGQWKYSLKVTAKNLCGKPVDCIETSDVLASLWPIWSKFPDTAVRTRGRIERVLAAAKAEGFIQSPYENPARWKDHLEFILPAFKEKNKEHHPAVPWQDMPAFWARLLAVRKSTSALALQFTILTAARTGEVLGAPWREINLDTATWTIPKERMKMKKPHRVALSAPALAILRKMATAGTPPEKMVFPGAKGGKPLSDMAMLQLMRGHFADVDAVPHGMRSSFKDWAADGSNYDDELSELALAHALGNKVKEAYRRGDALEKRRPMMDDWAAFLMGK